MYLFTKRNYVGISNQYSYKWQKQRSKQFTTFWNQNIVIYFTVFISIFLTYFSLSEGGIACLSNPCIFGLCVDDVNSSYACYCIDGYTGTNCQTEWDECWSQPCLNGGECLDLVAAYNCSCPEGFSGPSCEYDRDECLSQPCLNNGTCVDGSNGFECYCLPGYSGSICEWDISVCNSTDAERCLNGGACIEGPGEKFWCTCTPGWSGVLCEEPLDPCLLLQPCLHGGLCLSRGSDFICACPFGYTGLRCEQELALCDQNPCLNGAICVEENERVCYCVPDFHGELCQFQYDECLLPPTPSCKNGGTCIDGVDGFSCSCPSDVTGKFCECPIGFDCSNHTYHPVRPTISSPKFTTKKSENEIIITGIATMSTENSVQGSDKTMYPGTTDFSIQYSKQTSDSTEHSLTTSTYTTSLSYLNSSTESSLITGIYDYTNISSPVDTSLVKSEEISTLVSIQKSSSSIYVTPPPVYSTTEVPTFESYSTPAYDVSASSKTSHFPGSSSQLTSVEYSHVTESPFTLSSSTDTIETLYSDRTISPLEYSTASEILTVNVPASLMTTDITSYDDASITPDDIHYTKSKEGVIIIHDSTVSSIIPSTKESVTDFIKDMSEASLVSSTVESLVSSTVESWKSTHEYIDNMTTELVLKLSSSTEDIGTVSTTFTDSVVTRDTTEAIFNETGSGMKSSEIPLVSVPKNISVSHFTSPLFHYTLSYKTTELSTSPRVTKVGDMPSSMDVPHVTTSSHATPSMSTVKLPSSTEKGTDLYSTTFDPMSARGCDEKIATCQNGGTCIPYGNGFQCLCPLKFDGVNCEKPSNMTEVSLLPSSWLLFRVLTPAVETLATASLSFSHRLEATLRIVSEEGVVFTLIEAEESQAPGYHMQMSLHKGRLRLQFSCGLQSVRFSESKQRIDTGYPIKISASLTIWAGNESSPDVGRCRAELRLNNSLAVSGEQLRQLRIPRRHAAIAHLVFGAWPRARHATHIPFNRPEEEEDLGVGPAAPGVTACLSKVKVNGWLRLLLADITNGTTDITECVQLACLSNPCLHGGTCEEMPFAIWRCRCPTGRLGAQCEKSVCANSPCEGGSTCLVHPGTNFVCLCSFGRQGIFCEQELQVSRPCLVPTLVGVSPHLALPLTPRHSSFRHGVELSLRFTAARTHQVALLAYLGHGPRDHMALSYVHGRVMLTWDLGSGPRRIFTSREFVAGIEQEIHVGRSGREAWLRVIGDNGTHSGHSTGKMSQLNTRPVLLIGGFDRGNSSLLQHDLPKHSGFEGCISNLEIKTGSSITRYFPSGPPYPPFSPVRGRAVSQYGTQPCSSSPCLHRGICLPHGPSFTCLCAQGWFGPVCAESSNPCDSQTNLCAEGSTCVPLLRSYECDCPLGKTGPFCRTVESRGTVVWPEVYFSGRRSYIEIPRITLGYSNSDPGIPKHSCVEFEMKLSSSSSGSFTLTASQVMFFSRDVDTGDYMVLILTPERDMQFLLGTGDGPPMLLRSPRGNAVRLGTWVRIRAGRVGRSVFLSVGGRPVSSWLLPGQAGEWSGGAAPLYIGGAPDLSIITPLVWSSIVPFSGCLRRLHVDWRKVLVHIGKARSTSGGNNLSINTKSFQEPAIAQLTPEYLRQVHISENWSSPSLSDDLTNLFQHESLAALVSGQKENFQNWNPKDYANTYNLKQKADSASLNSVLAIAKFVTPMSLSTSVSTFFNNTKQTHNFKTFVNANNEMTGTTTSVPNLLSRRLRSRDALFVSSARNVYPCEKSLPAMVQLEPCIADNLETRYNCQNLQYQAQETTISIYPSFQGNGWLTVKVPAQRLRSFDSEWSSAAPFSFLRIRFSATQPNGVIVWAQQDEAGGAFVGVGLKDGRLSVVWGTNKAKPHFITTILSSSLADGLFHSVSVLWDCSGEAKEAHVWVDGERGEVELEHDRSRRKRQQQHAAPSFIEDKPSLTIYLGGFPDSHAVSESSLGHFKSPLNGCIAELSWDDESVLLSEFASYPHHNVFPCK